MPRQRTEPPPPIESPPDAVVAKFEERLGRVERAIGAMATQLHGLGGSGRVARKDMDLAVLMAAYEADHIANAPTVTLAGNLHAIEGGAR